MQIFKENLIKNIIPITLIDNILYIFLNIYISKPTTINFQVLFVLDKHQKD